MTNKYKALVLRKSDDGTAAAIETLTDADLPEGDVLVDVAYSGLNYKDAMAVTGSGPIVRTWPMVPGIDLAGTVVESTSADYKTGDSVILTGWGVGERYWGGYAQRQRVNSKWLVPLPKGLDARAAMAIGTAGLTAMLCVMRLEDAGMTPDQGTALVTGASGGVGSVAIAILSKRGYKVAALTTATDDETHDYLRSLGAAYIVPAFDTSEKAKPLEGQQWACAIDTVGSKVLARVLAQTQYGGAVAACGLAAGPDLPTTVMPFILRNVGLLGVDSVECPYERRVAAWQRLASNLDPNVLERMIHDATLEQVEQRAATMMRGGTRGRTVISLND